MKDLELEEISVSEAQQINGGGLLVWAIALGIYNGYQQYKIQ